MADPPNLQRVDSHRPFLLNTPGDGRAVPVALLELANELAGAAVVKSIHERTIF